MATKIQDGLEVDVTVTGGLDAEGNPKAIDAAVPVTGVSSDTSLLEVVPGPDNATVTVRTVPGPGVGLASITITGDGDAGEGVKPVSVVHTFEVEAGDTVSLTTSVGEFRPRTEAPPA